MKKSDRVTQGLATGGSDDRLSKEHLAKIISNDEIVLLVRNAALTCEIDPEIAITVTRLLFTAAALSEGPAMARVTLKIHDTSQDDGLLRMHGSNGFCLACIKIDTQLGHQCLSISPGGKVTRCCLLPNSLIRVSSSEVKRIGDLAVGDTVLGVDRSSGRIIGTRVSFVLNNHMRDHHIVLNDELRLTDDHPLLDAGSGRWLAAGRCIVGTRLRTTHGSVTVRSVARHEHVVETVYCETDCGTLLVAGAEGDYIVNSTYAADYARLLVA